MKELIVFTLFGKDVRKVYDNVKDIEGIEEANLLAAGKYDMYAITSGEDVNTLQDIYSSIREVKGVLSAERSLIVDT